MIIAKINKMFIKECNRILNIFCCKFCEKKSNKEENETILRITRKEMCNNLLLHCNFKRNTIGIVCENMRIYVISVKAFV